MNMKYVLLRSKEHLRNLPACLKNMKLTTKLNLSYIIILIIPIFFLGNYAVKNVEQKAYDDSLKQSEQALIDEKEAVSHNMELCRRVSQTMISNKKLASFLGNNNQWTGTEMVQFKNDVLTVIQDIQYANTDIYKIKIYTSNPYIDKITTLVYNEEYLGNPELLNRVKKQKGRFYWVLDLADQPPSILSKSNERTVSVFRELVLQDTTHIGVVEVDFLLQKFFDGMFNASNDTNTAIFLVENGQKLIYNKNNGIFSQSALDPLLFTKAYVNEDSESGSYNIIIKNEPFVVVYSRVKELSAYLYHVTSMKKVISDLNAIKMMIWAGSALAMIVLSLINFLITSALFKKMHAVIATIKKVQDGELFAEIPSQGSDEVGELARHFNTMLKKINELIYIMMRKQSATKDAEIKALHMQINAHFLFNVLESIKMMAAIEGKYEISDALTALGRMMRYSLNWKYQFVTLEDEINQIRNYVMLINIRYDSYIELSIQIEESYLKYEILKMILQPIVENSVVHGFEPEGIGGTICVQALAEGSTMNIDITDNGKGIGDEKLRILNDNLNGLTPVEEYTTDSHGIGLANVNERIKLFYGNEYGLVMICGNRGMTKLRVQLPYPASADASGGNGYEKHIAG